MFTRKTRVISAIAAVCMLISMMACIAIPAYAADAYNASNTAKITAFTSSTATAASAYVITTPEEMEYAATIANNDKLKNTTVYLAADINLSGKGSFIGFGAAQFNVDGQGHTISNWKNTTATRVALVMKGKCESIKNIRFLNCDVNGADHTALVYGSHNGDGISNGTLTISNITVEDCDMKATTQAAFILANTQARPCNISNIVIKNSTIAGNGNNLAAIIGRMSGTGKWTITGAYVDGVTITGGADNCGLVVGCLDSYSATIKNAVVSNSSITATTKAGILGGRANGNDHPIYADILLYKNTITAADAHVVRGNRDWFHYTKPVNFYSDTKPRISDTNNTGKDDFPYTAITEAQYTSGEMAYTLSNNAAGKYTMFWEMENGKIVPTDEAGRTRKVTVELSDGSVVTTAYVDGGETLALPFSDISNISYDIKQGSGNISGGILTVGATGDVVVQVQMTSLDFAKISLKNTIDYFDARNISYFAEGAAVALANAKSVYEAASSDVAAYTAANNTLASFKTQMASYPNIPSVLEIDLYPNVKDFKITTADELVAADGISALYADDITLHLGADIDMAEKTFDGFDASNANFDGHDFTISNWDHANTIGFFANYKGGTIKNVTFDGCDVGGGYGRALLCGNNTAGNTTIENVHVKNCTVAENSNGNLAGIFFGQFAVAEYVGTVRNCSVINTEIKSNCTGSNYGITNTGIISGRASHKTTYNVENLYVDGFRNNAFTTVELPRGNGVLFGTVEDALTAINVDGVVITNCSGAGIHDIVGRTYYDKAINVKNVVSVNNETSGLHCIGFITPADSVYTKTTFDNVYTDHEILIAKVATADVNGNAAAMSEPIRDVDGITPLEADDATNGKAAYLANCAISDGGFLFTTTYKGIALGKEENATHKIVLEDLFGAEVGAVYGNAGSDVNVASPEFDGYTLKAGSNGAINGTIVSVPVNGGVVVVVSMSEQGALIQAKRPLQEAIDYFKVDRILSYFNQVVADAVAEAESLLETTDTTKVQEVKDKTAALNALKTGNYAGTPENAPGFSEMAKYPNAPLYVIRVATDFQGMEDHKDSLTANDTVYMVADIDMKGSAFNGIVDFKASFDGMGHTIRNWGIAADGTKTPINTQGLFYNTKTGAGVCYSYIKSIKNVTMENCHTTSGASYGAMLLGVNHNNAGLTGGSATLDLSNIHFVDCSMTATAGEVYAFLLTRYAHQTENAVINITNCSVTGSTMNGGGCNHVGLLTAKLRGGSKPAVYNIKDCYVGGNTYNTSRIWAAGTNNYGGMILGTVEAYDTTVNLTNIGAVGNTVNISGSGNYVNLLACSQSSTINANGVMIAGTTITGNANPSVYVVNGTTNHTFNKVYCDASLTAVSSGDANLNLTGTGVGGEAAWNLNTVSGGNLWWTTVDGVAAKGTDANATRKVELKLSTGDTVTTYYVNVGSTQVLDYTGFEGEDFEYSGTDAMLNGNKLILSKNTDVVVNIKLYGGELVIEAANTKINEQIKVKIKVNSSAYGFSKLNFDLSYDSSLLKLENSTNLNCMENVSISDNHAGKITVDASHFENIYGEVGIVELIFEPLNAEATLAFEAQVDAYVLDAAKKSIYVEMDCNRKTIENYEQALRGDVNDDGVIDIMDVVAVLRVIVGNLKADKINYKAANIHTADGVTDNYGINLLDAITLLRKAMENF